MKVHPWLLDLLTATITGICTAIDRAHFILFYFVRTPPARHRLYAIKLSIAVGVAQREMLGRLTYALRVAGGAKWQDPRRREKPILYGVRSKMEIPNFRFGRSGGVRTK